MKKIPNWIIVTIVFALLIASKYLFFSKKDDKSSAAKGKVAPISVNYYIVKPITFKNTVFTTGKIGAFNQIDIIPEVNGKVTAIFFKEGESVSKGSLLLKLNDADLQAQLLKVKTQLKLSEQKLTRLKKLFEIKGVSQEELDIQENETLTLKSDEAFILAQIAKTNITAPFDGVIGLKNISEGSYVNASNPIASLVQLKPLFIEFSIPEKYNTVLKNGLSLNFSLDENSSSETFSAKIYAIEPKIDEATKTIKARAVYSGDKNFYPGSFVKVFVELGELSNTLMIPTQCVIPVLKGQKVFINRNGLAQEVQVKIGLRTDDKIQILEGVQAGDTIITTGLLSIKKESVLNLIKAVN